MRHVFRSLALKYKCKLGGLDFMQGNMVDLNHQRCYACRLSSKLVGRRITHVRFIFPLISHHQIIFMVSSGGRTGPQGLMY